MSIWRAIRRCAAPTCVSMRGRGGRLGAPLARPTAAPGGGAARSTTHAVPEMQKLGLEAPGAHQLASLKVTERCHKRSDAMWTRTAPHCVDIRTAGGARARGQAVARAATQGDPGSTGTLSVHGWSEVVQVVAAAVLERAHLRSTPRRMAACCRPHIC